MPAWLPYLVGGILVAQFLGLSVWQVDRGLEKRASRAAFAADTGYSSFVDGMAARPYQRLVARGRFLEDRQFLLDNIILESRNGHYVLTPLELGEDEPLLLVNRGWIASSGDRVAAEDIALPGSRLSVRGRAGSLPRAGYRMGPPFDGGGAWPRHAVYPTLEEVGTELGRELQPFVLLMDPGDDHGYVRYWVPEEFGPGRHYAYAFQWFAMAAALAGLLAWNYRRRGFE